MTFLIATLIIIGLDMSFLWFIPIIIVYAASRDLFKDNFQKITGNQKIIQEEIKRMRTK